MDIPANTVNELRPCLKIRATLPTVRQVIIRFTDRAYTYLHEGMNKRVALSLLSMFPNMEEFHTIDAPPNCFDVIHDALFDNRDALFPNLMRCRGPNYEIFI